MQGRKNIFRLVSAECVGTRNFNFLYGQNFLDDNFCSNGEQLVNSIKMGEFVVQNLEKDCFSLADDLDPYLSKRLSNKMIEMYGSK